MVAARANRWLGLDLGGRVLKLVEVEAAGSGVRVTGSLVQELPQGAPDATGWLQTGLKEFQARQVHAAVSAPEFALRRVHVPPMSSGEMAEGLKWQVKDQVSFPVQDAVLEFRVLGDVWDKDVKQQDVLVAAAAREAVAAAVAVIERAGGKAASVTPLQFALWRCVSALMPGARQGSVAVVELGTGGTEVVIAKEGHVRLVRHLPIGAGTVAEALVGVVTTERGEVSIDRAKAEAIQRRYGVLTEGTEGATEDGVPLFHLASLMRPVLEKLLTELSRVLDFYKVQMDEAGVSRLLLCGEGATLKHLSPYVADGLGMPADIFNPLLHVPGGTDGLSTEALAERGPRLAAAMGAALNRGQELNLLAASSRRHRSPGAPPWERVALGAAGAVLAGALLLGVAQGLQAWRISGQRQVWRHLEAPSAAAQALAGEHASVDATAAGLHALIDRQPVWEGVFRALSSLVPASIELDELTVGLSEREYRLEASGHSAGSEDASPEAEIAALIDALNDSPFFDDAGLITSEMHAGETGWTRFEIEAVVE